MEMKNNPFPEPVKERDVEIVVDMGPAIMNVKDVIRVHRGEERREREELTRHARIAHALEQDVRLRTPGRRRIRKRVAPQTAAA
jgi:hypothetical protein